MIGVIGRAYYMETYGSMDGFDPEHIFILMAGDMFVPIIAGLLFAALMAAIMSTADSQLLVSASAITNDVLKKLNKDISDNKLMWISRGVVVLISVLALILAINGSDSIMGLVSYAWAGFGAAFGPLMILSLYWKRMNLYGAYASVISGFLVVILWNTFLAASTGIYELLPGFIISLIVGVVVSLATPEPSQDIQDEFDAAQVYEEPMNY